MRQNITPRGILANTKNLAALFLFILVSVLATSCQTEEFEKGNKPSSNDGDTFFSFDGANKLQHGDWDVADGLAKVSHNLSGYIIHSKKVNNELTEVGRDELSEALPMTIKYTAKYEGTNLPAVKYLSQETSSATEKSSIKNNRLTNKTFNKTTTLKFEGFDDVKLDIEYLVAYLGQDAGLYCDYLKSEVTVKADTLPEIIKKEDGDYKREITTIKVKPLFVDMPAKTPCTESVVELTLTRQNDFRVNIQPGEKIYVDKSAVEGSDKYYPLANGNFHTERKYNKIFTQDEKTVTEVVTFSAEARIVWTILKDNLFPVKTIEFGNPVITPSFLDDKEFSVKDANFKFKVRHHTFDALWDMGYAKKVSCDVDHMYAVDEHDTYELPSGESTLAYTGYVPGQATETLEYTTYNDGILKFNGNHAAQKDYPLEVGQVFQIKKDRKFIGYKSYPTLDELTGKATLKITEVWDGEPEKEVWNGETTMTSKNYGSPIAQFFGTSLSFISGLIKTVDEGTYVSEGNDIMAATVKTTWTARLNLGNSAVYNERTQKYVLFSGKKFYFKGYNEPKSEIFESKHITLTNTDNNFVSGEDTYTRRTYDVAFILDGKEIVNVINVDELQPKQPTIDPEYGYLDWEKSKQFGGLSIVWDVINGKLVPKVALTLITSKGVFYNVDKTNNLYAMDINTLAARLSLTLSVPAGVKWNPGSVEVKTNPNPVWKYTGLDMISTTSVNGVDILKIPDVDINKPFVATPTDGTETIKYSNGRVKVTYKGEVIFDEVFHLAPNK